jgi:hypothetical protein
MMRTAVDSVFGVLVMMVSLSFEIEVIFVECFCCRGIPPPLGNDAKAFRGSIPSLHVPLSTLRAQPHD